MNRFLSALGFVLLSLMLFALPACTFENEWLARTDNGWGSGNQWGGRQRVQPRLCDAPPQSCGPYGAQDRVTYIQTPAAQQCPPSYPTTILITNASCYTISRIRVSGGSVSGVISDRTIPPATDAEISIGPYGSGEMLLVATLEHEGRVVARDSQRFQLSPQSTRPIEWTVRSTSLAYDGQPVPGSPPPADCPDCPKRPPAH